MNTFSGSASTALSLITSFDPTLQAIVVRSLAVSACATLIACSIGLLAGAWLGVARFRGRGAVLALLNTALALPSVVVGLVVYLLLSRSGPLGFLGWLFSFKAMVLAQSLLVLPVVAALVRQTIEDADRLHGEQLQSLGAGRFLRSVLLLWDERYALLTVVIAAFGRAISEVGAVMVVGGNIDGFTRVMTTSIALETSKGDLPLALALGIVLLAVVLLLNIAIALVQALARTARRPPARCGGTAARGCDRARGAAVTQLFKLDAVSVSFGPIAALNGLLAAGAGGRPAGPHRRQRQRQEHAAALPSWSGSADQRVTVEHDARVRQAMLFQRPYLLRASVLVNIALGLWLRGVPWKQARVDALQALARVGLAELAPRNARALSGWPAAARGSCAGLGPETAGPAA